MRAIAVMLVSTAMVAFAAPPIPTYDLNQPGMLDWLEQDNPAHYTRIVAMLEVAQQRSCEETERVFKVEYDAEAHCRAMTTLMSEPPKKHMSFVLDGRRYMKFIAILPREARRVPLK